jgi:hypothetical protein
MTSLHDALQSGLRALEAGKTEEEALALHPDLAGEVRPVLRAALVARAAGRHDVAVDVRRRGRVKLLQRAALMRETSVRLPRRIIPILPRLAMTLGLVAILVVTSTGLVRASSGTLPGDQLYPVKRSWEGLRLWLVYRPQEHRLLESSFEQERLDETGELLARGRAAPITFSGLLTKQQDGTWLVSGIPVAITGVTDLPPGTIPRGSPVVIDGVTGVNGVVEAERVQVLLSGAPLPPLEPSDEDGGKPTAVLPPSVGPSRQGSTVPEGHDAEQHTFTFTGTVEFIGEPAWRINGQAVYVDAAGIVGSVKVGSDVSFEGYYGADGRFIVTRIEAGDNPRNKVRGSEKDPGAKSGDSKPGDGAGGGDDSGGDPPGD